MDLGFTDSLPFPCFALPNFLADSMILSGKISISFTLTPDLPENQILSKSFILPNGLNLKMISIRSNKRMILKISTKESPHFLPNFANSCAPIFANG